MIRVLPRNILRFAFLVLAQILLFNNIQFSGYINPYIYILFILLMPFETPGWILLISGFSLGLSIDIFMNTIGLHTTATIILAFTRPYILNVISPRDGYEPGSFPRIFYYGFNWFLRYTISMVLIHHFTLFFLEVFRFEVILHTIVRIILSSLFSVSLIIISQYFVFRK